MRQRISKEQFLKENFELSDYNKKGIESDEKLAVEISKFYPAYILIDISEYDNKRHYESSGVYMDYNGLKFSINRYSKQYRIYCIDLENLKNVNYHDKASVKSSIASEPNNIGVLTTKKIMQWLEYYEKFHNTLKELNNKNSNKIASFYKSIEHLPFKYGNGKKTGYIVKNGIEYSFEVSENHISERIRLHYSAPNSIETFLKLSDNKYNQ